MSESESHEGGISVVEGPEGEFEGESQPGPCGCCNSIIKTLTFKGLFERTFGDWLIIGMTIMALTALTYFVKK